MSNTNITTGQLLRWHDELKQLSEVGSIFYQFNRSKIQGFYQQNGIRIDSAFKKIFELRKEFYLFENEKFTLEERDGKQALILLPDKTQEDYDAKFKEIMESTVSIIL